jgi:hypothetical protein
MSGKSLSNWVYRARQGQELVKRMPGKPVSELEAELSRLRQENAKLKLEKEILKNRLRGLPRPIWIETSGAYTVMAPDRGRLLFGGIVPVKKPGPGEATDPTVVAR